MKKQSERALAIRARRSARDETKGRCPVHGHAETFPNHYGDPIRFGCGCPTGRWRR